MARKPRLHIPGGFYHVILRGNGGQDIFYEDTDRTRFFLLLQEGTERFYFRLHCFCLMNNHVHLVIQVGEIPLSRIIQNLSFRYTKYINKKKKRVGHLFQGRYKAILVDADSYLLELVRYIHSNPVRASIVNNPLEYPWSSYPSYIGTQDMPFLTTSLVLGQFAKTEKIARRKFAEFVEQGTGEGHRKDLYSGIHDSRILGDDRFAESVLSRKIITNKANLDDVIRYICKKSGLTEKELASPSRKRKPAELRGVIGWLARQLEVASLSDVAIRFNRDLATVSRAVRNIEEQQLKSKELKKRLEDGLRHFCK